MKHAARDELEKATGEKPRKNLLETVMIRSFKNQFKDTMMQWKNLFTYTRYSYERKKGDGKDDWLF